MLEDLGKKISDSWEESSIVSIGDVKPGVGGCEELGD